MKSLDEYGPKAPKAERGPLRTGLLASFVVLGAALILAEPLGRPSPVKAQGSANLRIGLPSYVPEDPQGSQRVMFTDSSVSINTTCPVRGNRVDPQRDPVYVNGQSVAFCCHPCPAAFSADPERYLREMKASLRCPVRPSRLAVLDSSLRTKINQDIFFFSSRSAMKLFENDPLRYCGKLTDPVSRVRFQPTKQSPHVRFRGRMYYFADSFTLARFQAKPELFYERLTDT